MSNPISVVIPTLDRPSLPRAITSAATQSLAPHEIIVVSNGSSRIAQERVDLLVRLASPVSLRVLSLPPFSGPSVSRNVGAWAATSSHVAFLDDDDEFTPCYLEIMWTRIADEDPDIAYGSKVWRNPDGSVRREKRIHTVPEDLWLETLYRQENPGFGGQNVLVRRSAFFDIGGFPVDLPSGEDRAFAMAALLARSRMIYVDEAEVTCHDPVGYRANARPDKWVTNLKLITTYWGHVSGSSRLRSTWRLLRTLARRQGASLASRFTRGRSSSSAHRR